MSDIAKNNKNDTVEMGRKIIDEMYKITMAFISAGSALIDNKVASTTMTFWSGGIDLFKNQVLNKDDNHYKAVGRAVGDILNLGTTLKIQKTNLFKKASLKGKAATGFLGYEYLANIDLGDKFANLFNTYVAFADKFEEKIRTDESYFQKIKNGLYENGLSNFADYFDPDGDGKVSPSDILNGYKKLFSPPPAFGTPEFEMELSANKPNEVTIKSDNSNKALNNEIFNVILRNNDIEKIVFNSQILNRNELRKIFNQDIKLPTTHKITTTLNLNSLLKPQTKLQDKTQISSVNIPHTKLHKESQIQTKKPTISKKPSIAILANLDKLTPKELLDELHRLKNLPIKNDFTYEAMSKIQNQLEKFNQTDNINLENGMKV